MATGEQYIRLAINFGLIASASRLLTPTEIGVSVIGLGIMLIAQGVREFATPDVLIRHQEVRREDVRTSFSLLLLLAIAIAGAIFSVAPWIGDFYGEEKLAQFLRITALAVLFEALSLPIIALLRRDMQFGKLALVNTTSVALNAATTIGLAFAGFSYMSFAWGYVVAAATVTTLTLYFRPDLSIYRLTLHSWRNILRFGGYNGASFTINRIYQSLPQLVLGHLLPHSAVGIYNRANVVSDIPDRIILQSVIYIAFPALAAEVREGHDLKAPYLSALSYITVFYWPAQVLIIALAHPIVMFVLGEQWTSVVPLLQLLALGAFAWFPVILTAPLLLAMGAIRDRMMADLIGRAASTVVLCGSAPFGVLAMAASKLVTQPFQMMVSFCFVRRHVFFSWHELAVTLWKSTAATICTAVGPAIVVGFSETGFDLSGSDIAIAVLLAVAGWSIAIISTRHPVLSELGKATQSLSGTALAKTMGDRMIAWSADR